MSVAPIQFAVSSSEGRSELVNGSRLVNFFTETLPPDSKEPSVLYGTPGQNLFSTLPTSPVLALIVLTELLYAVTSTRLYSVSSSGVHIDLGLVTLSGNVSIASNGKSIAFVDGVNGYYYSVAGGLHQFSGDGWYPANTVCCQDDYFIFNRKGTGQFFFTGILDVTLDPLDYATAEASPDNTLAIFSDQSSIWIFGEKSIEIWYNDGITPWARMHGAYIERGISAPYSGVKMDNSLFFVGDNGVVYRTSGYSVVRVSTHSIEYEFLRGNTSNAYAYSYSNEGHVFYVLTIPDIERTCVYDTATGLWHERSHSIYGRHNGKCYVRCYGLHLIGDFQNGNISSLDMQAYTDNGTTIIREAVAPVIHRMMNRVSMNEFTMDVSFELQGVNDGSHFEFEDWSGYLLLEDGNELLASTSSDDGINLTPTIGFQWSDDGTFSWSKIRTKEFSSVDGRIKLVRWFSLGQFIQRHIKITVSDSGPITVAGAYTKLVQDDN